MEHGRSGKRNWSNKRRVRARQSTVVAFKKTHKRLCLRLYSTSFSHKLLTQEAKCCISFVHLKIPRDELLDPTNPAHRITSFRSDIFCAKRLLPYGRPCFRPSATPNYPLSGVSAFHCFTQYLSAVAARHHVTTRTGNDA